MNDFTTLFDRVWERRVSFLLTFVGVLFFTYAVLVIIDFVPKAPSEPTAPVTTGQSVDQPDIPDSAESSTESVPVDVIDPVPHTLIIDALGREILVLNPTSRTIPDLDRALEQGAVRHPDSADFEREGNIFILGHSSYLPTVLNRNFQIFNGIQNLRWGDTLRLISSDTEYVYRVERVYEAKASEVTVPIANTGPRLTLATCDSFGSLDDRFIVEAILVSERPLTGGGDV